ncbi:MAG TPA: cytochrome c [Bryobacteraceae bacterium]|nr:cytochrome c [Bryobacteraceae bacterium]
MKTTHILPILLALGFGICLVAQTEADYPGWMKDVAATKGKLSKDVKGKQNAEAATEAKHLASLYDQLSTFWSGRKASDAVTIAKNGATASNELAAAANAGDEAKMESSLQTINGTCGACHRAHREGSPGSFKIK